MTTAAAPARQWSRSEAALHFDVAASLVRSSGPHPFARAPRWRSSKPLHAASASAPSAGPPERPKSACARINSTSPVWLDRDRDRATQQHAASVDGLQRRVRLLEVENGKLKQELAKWMRCLEHRQDEVTTLRESARNSGEEAAQWRANAQRYMVEAEQAREEASRLGAELAATRGDEGGVEGCSFSSGGALRLAHGQGNQSTCGGGEADGAQSSERGMGSQLLRRQQQPMLTGPADLAVIGGRPLGAESLRPPLRMAVGHESIAAQSCAIRTPPVTPRSIEDGDEPRDNPVGIASRACGGLSGGHESSMGHVAARRPAPHMNRAQAHRPAPQRRAVQVAVTIPAATQGYTRGSGARKPSVPSASQSGGECDERMGERGTA